MSYGIRYGKGRVILGTAWDVAQGTGAGML